MQDDTARQLDEIQITQATPIVATLISIQRYQRACRRDFSFFDPLRCLHINTPDVGQRERPRLDSVELSKHDRNFAAVSYVWKASEYENGTHGGYKITSQTGETKPAEVRDVVLDRIIRYVTWKGLSHFWIDKECIDQRKKKQKNRAVQCMDILYRRSSLPVGILCIPLMHQRHINHVNQLLATSAEPIITGSNNQLQLQVSRSKAYKILQTLFRIMCDPWWTRRWIFQEEYCTNTAMELLLPKAPTLIEQSTNGDGPDDLIMNAWIFREQTTRFCIACKHAGVFKSAKNLWQCEFVLGRAKSYNVLREYGWQLQEADRTWILSNYVLGDICTRGVSLASDTLAIIANVCGYTVRLDAKIAKAADIRSLSLGILALFVLNGEILQQKSPHRIGTMLDFIRASSFGPLTLPAVEQQLTFSKRCRLSKVLLTSEGIQTEGYLWRCCQTIRLRLNRATRQHREKVLDELIRYLERHRLRGLQSCFENYRIRVLPRFLDSEGLRNIFDDMVEHIVQTLMQQGTLLLGRLKSSEEIAAIFVAQEILVEGSSVFTSSERAEDAGVKARSRFVDKFVSLEVDKDERTCSTQVMLRARDWANGIWLPSPCHIQKVVFPWPSALQATKI